MLTLNTVPSPELPPYHATPYKVFPDRSSPPCGRYPSRLVFSGPLGPGKLCKATRPVPSVSILNTVPPPKLPPPEAVPYSVEPDEINLPTGKAPPKPLEKSGRFVKLSPSVLTRYTVPPPP